MNNVNMPFNEMAEVATMGALLTHKDAINLFMEREIDESMFYKPRSRRIVKTIVDVYELHGFVEVQVVLESITKDKKGATLTGGLDYLMNFVDNASTLSSLDHYLDIIEEKHRLRLLINLSQEIIKESSTLDTDVSTFLFETEERVMELTRSKGKSSMQSSQEVVKESLEAFHKALDNDGEITGLKTGFQELDFVTNGLQKGDLIIIGARPSVGKGHPNWLELPTPKGNKKVGDLVVGDYVFDRYGKPTKVTGVYPRGKLETYKVTLNDGRSTIVDGDHIWSHFMLSGCGNENLIDKTTSYMYEQGVRSKSNRAKYSIPTNKPVHFEEKEHDVDPYVVGALIGDGCLLESRLTISSGDSYVTNKVADLLEANVFFTKHKNYTWRFEDDEGFPLRTKKTLNGLEEMQVYSHLKEIPEEYLYDSYENRMKLLNGLFDTDGCATNQGKKLSINYSTTSEVLKDQIVWLLQSCGYLSGVALDIREGRRTCYMINVLSDLVESRKLFTLQRKIDVIDSSDRIVHRKYDRIGIKSIEKTGIVEDITCISVAHEEQLYLANDFIVTHNTAFALNLGLNVAQLNNDGNANVAVFSLEMPSTHLMNRLLSTTSTVPNHKIRNGKVNQDEYNSIMRGANELQKTNIFIDDQSGTTVPDVFKQCRALKQEHGLDFIIIDYLQLLSSKGASQNREQEVSKMSRQLKQLARELDVPVIALSQLSRNLEHREDKRPRLSDLRESGGLEMNADIVMFLHRDDYGSTNEDEEEQGTISDDNNSPTLLRISKHRNGSLRDIDMMFEKDTGKFYDIDNRY